MYDVGGSVLCNGGTVREGLSKSHLPLTKEEYESVTAEDEVENRNSEGFFERMKKRFETKFEVTI